MKKTMCLAVVAAVALAGCGGGSVRTEGPGSGQPATAAEESADLWAQSVFGIYGQNALDSCLAGFHHEFKATATPLPTARTWRSTCAPVPAASPCFPARSRKWKAPLGTQEAVAERQTCSRPRKSVSPTRPKLGANVGWGMGLD